MYMSNIAHVIYHERRDTKLVLTLLRFKLSAMVS